MSQFCFTILMGDNDSLKTKSSAVLIYDISKLLAKIPAIWKLFDKLSELSRVHFIGSGYGDIICPSDSL